MNNFLEIGKILRPKGIQGTVKVEGFTDDNSRFLHLKEALIDDKIYTVKKAKIEGDFVTIKFDGVDSIDTAETLRNKIILVKREDAVKLPEDTNFIVDLIGMSVYVEDRLIGKIIDVYQFGTADVYVVKNGKKEISFPALKKLILETDLENNKMTLDKKVFKEVAI